MTFRFRFDGQKHFGKGLNNYKEQENIILKESKQWLDQYFAGKQPDKEPAIHLIGTPFQLAVWEQLSKIPYGEMITYGGIARAISMANKGKNVSARAVGNAVGRNPISLIVPCHRVIGSNGKLTGYAGGLERKEFLLALEQGGNE